MYSEETTDDWLTLHSPHLLATAMGDVGANTLIGDPVGAKVYCLTNIRGDGLADALTPDDEVASLLAKKGAREPGTAAHTALVEKFQASPLSGAFSVIDMAFQRSKLDPGNPENAGNLGALDAFATSIGSAPFFTSLSAGADGSGPANGIELMSDLVALLRPASTIIALSWIDVANDGINFGITTLTSDPNSEAVQSKTSAWQFRTDQWPVFAEKVAAKLVTTAESWRSNLATPLPSRSK